MREILFRGKRVDNGEWVEAECYKHYKGDGIWEDSPEKEIYFVGGFACDTETIGQYTGLTDKNGNKIFEGDILKWDSREWGGEYNEIARWDHELFNMRENDWKEWCEIIGNIYDNPELVREQK